MSNYKTSYDFIYKLDGHIITEEPTFSDDFMVAAVKEIYNGDKLFSRDQFIDDSCWVPFGTGCYSKAVELRKMLILN